MSDPFPAGTVVYLKSGSPPLTVTRYDRVRAEGAEVVDVEWFVDDLVQRDRFLANCLTITAPGTVAAKLTMEIQEIQRQAMRAADEARHTS